MIDMALQIKDLRDFVYPDEPLAPRLTGDFINDESARVTLLIDGATIKLTTYESWWSPDRLDELANLLRLTAASVRKNT